MSLLPAFVKAQIVYGTAYCFLSDPAGNEFVGGFRVGDLYIPNVERPTIIGQGFASAQEEYQQNNIFA